MAVTITGLPPVQVLLSQMTPANSFTHNKGNDGGSTGSLLVHSLAKLPASSFPSIPQCLDIHIEVTLLGPLSFSSVYI